MVAKNFWRNSLRQRLCRSLSIRSTIVYVLHRDCPAGALARCLCFRASSRVRRSAGASRYSNTVCAVPPQPLSVVLGCRVLSRVTAGAHVSCHGAIRCCLCGPSMFKQTASALELGDDSGTVGKLWARCVIVTSFRSKLPTSLARAIAQNGNRSTELAP